MNNKSDSQEFEGGSVEEAVQKAISSLGIKREQMDIKVVCEERKGLFGMRGANPAKIKVSVKK